MRPKMKFLAAITILMWPCYQSFADVQLTGSGNVRCSEITQTIANAKAANDETHDWVRLNYMAWMQGFMSGRNEERRKSDSGIDTMLLIPDIHAQLDWVLTWCEDNSSKIYYHAVQAFFDMGVDAQYLTESIEND